MMRIKSLQHRFTLFILIPVALLLLTMGWTGFTFARNHLLTQWGEAAILKLQRAAHHIDMQLKRPKEMLKLFSHTAGLPHAMHLQRFILGQLEQMEGITAVELIWHAPEDVPSSQPVPPGATHGVMEPNSPSSMPKPPFRMMPFHRGTRVAVEPPRYDTPAGSETVLLVSDLKDQFDRTVGQIRVKMKFDALVDTITASGWWQEQKAFLVDSTGTILAGNKGRSRRVLGETEDPLERSTLYAMKSRPFGNLFGKGFPPSEVSGFYTLNEAPWTLVIVTAGKDILLPIVSFRLTYLGIGAAFTVIILLLIRLVTGKAVASMKVVSEAARRVAEGDYHIELTPVTADEVGELIESFNTMVKQLEERARMKDSLNLAREVQQNLFPRQVLSSEDLEIAGKSMYCDETGGDYYDFFLYPDSSRIGVAVGDVSGHGVAAALLMTTVRAMIRSHEEGADDPAEMITAVNRRLCDDTAKTGDFMTLFYLIHDAKTREIRWVRAGHDPAMLYEPEGDTFTELGGEGLALGVNERWVFTANRQTDIRYGQILLIGTDGIWEAENGLGERFGKKRLQHVVRQNSHRPAEGILAATVDELACFSKNTVQSDDITLVVIKVVG